MLTIADSERLLHSCEYADRVVESVLEISMRIEALEGTGRLYLPRAKSG